MACNSKPWYNPASLRSVLSDRSGHHHIYLNWLNSTFSGVRIAIRIDGPPSPLTSKLKPNWVIPMEVPNPFFCHLMGNGNDH